MPETTVITERAILPLARIHPAVRAKVADRHRDIIDEVEAAIAKHDIVIVGMSQNPHPRRARKLLRAEGIAHHYLRYGSYLSTWRRRNALKMWTGWGTFPMVFVKGTFVGGASDLERLLQSGELRELLEG